LAAAQVGEIAGSWLDNGFNKTAASVLQSANPFVKNIHFEDRLLRALALVGIAAHGLKIRDNWLMGRHDAAITNSLVNEGLTPDQAKLAIEWGRQAQRKEFGATFSEKQQAARASLDREQVEAAARKRIPFVKSEDKPSTT